MIWLFMLIVLNVAQKIEHIVNPHQILITDIIKVHSTDTVCSTR